MYTIKSLLDFGKEELIQKQIPNAEFDAWCLMECILKVDRIYYFTHLEEVVKQEAAKQYIACIQKRAEHYPLQYIIGYQEFMGYSFYVNESVLIPRQDTETLIETILRVCKNVNTILDMCTGSGCIAISLDKLLNPVIVQGVDISKQALKVARQNGQDLNSKVEFIQSDLFEKVEGTFDLIVSNPPYICTKEIETLMPEVKEYEPKLALDGKEDGLYFYREIVQQAKKYLNPNGALFFEIGFQQGKELKKMFEQFGYQNIQIEKDLVGLDRIAYAKVSN